jgi:sodium/hydrogen exchanger 8
VCPWVCYLVADGLEMSGIVAILTNGIFLSYYATPNITDASKQVVKTAVETLAYTAETLVFLFLGIGVFTFKKKYGEATVSTVLLSIINLNLARALNIWLTSKLANRARSGSSRISANQQFVMWIAGLRGAMAYALAMESAHSGIFNNPAIDKHSGDVMLVVTIYYSLFTILGISSFLHPIMTKSGVTSGTKADDEKTEIEQDLIDSIDRKKEARCCWGLKRTLVRFNKRYLLPLFT